MTEELSGGHVLDDSSQGSENLSVRGEKEKASVGSTKDNDESQGQRTQGRKRSTPSLAKGTIESCPIKKIKQVRKKGVVKPSPPTEQPGGLEPPLVEQARRLEKQEALVEALCLSVKQTNYHMNQSHRHHAEETQSLEF